nr:SufE family protein [Pelagibacteraceae bacterium]
ELLSTLGLDTLLTPGRRNGVYSMLMKIKEYAVAYASN